ncbi:MAG: hypothetical protein KJ015_07605 [Myxococcales bacterium]|nr:hypothetical protein [Myxococcales bacterium]
MATFFQFDLRVLPCETCGAPLEGSSGGGKVICKYCRDEQTLARREDLPLVVGARMPEPERLALLRRQDAHPPPVPSSLAQICVGDRLIPWDVPEALARWRLARRRLAHATDPGAAEELFALTRVLSVHYEASGAMLELRALIEGALDELLEPRHRQILRAALARTAALTGHLTAAQAWLDGCDAYAADLDADGAHRLARACIDTARGDFAAVLAALGQSPTDVPLPNDLDPAAALLRANAWERSGNLARGCELLVHLAQHGGPLFELRAHELRERHPELGLCRQSWPASREPIQRIYAERAAQTGAPPVLVLAVVGALIVLACAAVLLFSLVGDVLDLGFGLHPITILIVMFVSMLGPPFILLSLADRRETRRALELRATGRPALGVIAHRVETGNATMGVAEISLRVLVLDADSGYLATTELYHRDPGSLTRGAAVALRIDPSDPHTFALVL